MVDFTLRYHGYIRFSLSCRPSQTGVATRLRVHLRVRRLPVRIRSGCFARGKGLLEIVDDIVDVFGPHRNTNKIFRHPRILLFFVAELLMSGTPGMNGQGLGIPDAT